MKLLVMVTGTTGSGKSTVVRKLATRGWETLHTGDIFRNRKLGDSREGLTVAVAAESTIRNSIEHLLTGNRSVRPVIRTVAMEAFPRSVDQLEWVCKHYPDWAKTVIYMDAAEKVRENRIRSRGLWDTQRSVDGDLRKMGNETGQLELLAQMCDVNRDVGFTRLDTTDLDTSMSQSAGQISVQAIELMIGAATSLHRSRRDTDAIDPKRMVQRMKMEGDEYLLASARKEPRMNRVDELVDCLWFNLLAFNAEGIDAYGVLEAFLRKSEVNQFRHESGTKPHVGASGDMT